VGFQFLIVSSGKMTAGLTYVLSTFIVICVVLGLIIGLVVTGCIVSFMLSERKKDIGVMKGIGCVTNIAFTYLMTEILIIVVVSCIVGVFLGAGSYLISIEVLRSLGYNVNFKPIDIPIVVLIFIAVLIVAYIAGNIPLIRAIKVKTVDALSGIQDIQTEAKNQETGTPSLLGSSFKIAYRHLERNKPVLIIACIVICFLLISTSLIGGFVASDTTKSYIENAIGSNVIMVANPEVCDQYVNLLTSSSGGQPNKTFNYLNPNYNLTQNFIQQINTVSGVIKVDLRLVCNATVLEEPGIIIEDMNYFYIGDHRKADAIVVGVEPGNVVNKWFISGRMLNDNDSYAAILGDSISWSSFDQPLKQGLKFQGIPSQNFNVIGVCVDPLNNGYVVYVPIRTLSNILNQNFRNAALIEIDKGKPQETVANIKEKAEENGLSIRDLNAVIQRNSIFVDNLWSAILPLPLLSLASTILCLISYMMLSISTRHREFGVIRALGAKSTQVFKIVLSEIFIIAGTGGAIGTAGGLLISFTILIPNPVINWIVLGKALLCLILAVLAICLLSLYPVRKVTRVSVAEVLYQP
jgi:ABC-type antimicrobial peptide transport system permease subunit